MFVAVPFGGVGTNDGAKEHREQFHASSDVSSWQYATDEW